MKNLFFALKSFASSRKRVVILLAVLTLVFAVIIWGRYSLNRPFDAAEDTLSPPALLVDVSEMKNGNFVPATGILKLAGGTCSDESYELPTQVGIASCELTTGSFISQISFTNFGSGSFILPTNLRGDEALTPFQVPDGQVLRLSVKIDGDSTTVVQFLNGSSKTLDGIKNVVSFD